MTFRAPAQYPGHAGTDAGLLAAVARGEARLTLEQGLELFTRLPLPTLGRWADARCRALHGDHLRTYVIDRNINYTNVCNAKCTFCAFRRDQGAADAYTLEYSKILDKVGELQAIGGTQILMQGGMNPDLPLDWYLGLLRAIKEKYPTIHVHGFSPPEFIEFVHFFNPPGAALEEKIRWVMIRLREAGLDSIPGGGGEIFAAPVRRKIGLGKCDAEAWLTVMYVAHTLGMFTSATMMFGHIEGHADRVHHMGLVREWQDRVLAESHEVTESASHEGPTLRDAVTPALRDSSLRDSVTPAVRDSLRGHYTAFISWPFQRENTPLGRVKDWGLDPAEPSQEFPGDAVARAWWEESREKRAENREERAGGDSSLLSALSSLHPLFGRRVRMAGASEYLRTQAISRLFLDNIYSIGASWVTMGPHIGQVALAYGANDMGSVMMEENVVSSAGTTYCLDEAVLCRLIRGAGFTPAQRDNFYDVLRVHAHEDPRSPDLAVTDWSTHRARKMHQEAPKAPKTAKLTVTAKS